MDSDIILVCLSHRVPIADFNLTAGECLVGRSRDCHLVIPHMSISRRHAQITVAESITVTDLVSTNGTFVDKIQIETSAVRLGQIVRFGMIDFRLSARGESYDHFDWDLSTIKKHQENGSPAMEDTVDVLSAAQRRVFELLIKGLSENDIATELQLSYNTVHSHTRDIYRLFEVHTRAELLSKFIPND